MVLQDLEIKALKASLQVSPIFYYRYVDDIVLAIHKEEIETILHTFNAHHKRLQFTIEIDEKNEINFLDTKIIITNNKLIFDLYHKPTFSSRYLNFYSQHPINKKRGIIIGMVYKIVLISNKKFLQKILTKAINILLKNSYPLPFIFDTIRNRLKYLINNNIKNSKKDNVDNNTRNDKKYFSIPYIKNI